MQTLIYPMAAHLALAAMLYLLLTIVRAPSVWGIGRADDGSNPFATIERRISANLSNQFEWPVFFYVICLLLISQTVVDKTQVFLAWGFVLGRLAHSVVQIGTNNIRLRGLVFTANFLAVIGMWIVFVFQQLASSTPG